MDETKPSVGQTKTMVPDADLGKFNWDLTVTDQGNFEFKTLMFLWFSGYVIPRERKHVQLDIQQERSADVTSTVKQWWEAKQRRTLEP